MALCYHHRSPILDLFLVGKNVLIVTKEESDQNLCSSIDTAYAYRVPGIYIKLELQFGNWGKLVVILLFTNHNVRLLV